MLERSQDKGKSLRLETKETEKKSKKEFDKKKEENP